MSTRELLSPMLRVAARGWSAGARNAILAAALMLFASALFALQAALVKAGLRDMAPLELVFFRGLVCAALTYALLRSCGRGLATARPIGQISLGVIGFATLTLYFSAIGSLPLATATALHYTAPLFLVVLVGVQQARRATGALLLWVGGGFVGVCLVLQPSLGNGTSASVMIALLSGATGACGYLLLSRMARAGESEALTSFYYSAVVCVLAAVPTLAGGISVASWEQLGLVLGIGVLAAVGQLALGRAYKLAPPVIPATLSYSTVIFSSVIGAYWLGEQSGAWEMLGVAFIVASGILVSSAQAKPAAATTENVPEAKERERRREYLRWNLRSLYAVYKLARDPQNTSYVFMISDAQDDIAESERSRGQMTDPFRSGALESMWQARFSTPPHDVEALARLPAGTLGGDYARFMKSQNLRADFYGAVEPRHRMHYLRWRVRQTHDIWHVLTGYGTSEFGETALQAFNFGQFTNGQSAIILAAAILKSLLRGRLADLEKYLEAFCEGYGTAKRCESLLVVKWEELWSESVASLRQRYRIPEPSGLVRLQRIAA